VDEARRAPSSVSDFDNTLLARIDHRFSLDGGEQGKIPDFRPSQHEN